LTIINDIVDISIIEANQLVLYQELFCVDEVFRELKSYYRLKNEKHLDFIFVNESQSQNTFIFNDANRFRQIMTNLLNNAYKFTDKGFIKFGYQADGNTISFYVKDTGIGIDEDNLQKVFNDFHKIEPHANRFHQGTGIGLSISKRLVHLMGGEIFVESEVNKGSHFSFKLPFGDSGKIERKEINPAIEKKELHDLTIMIAEDEPDNFRLIEQLLKKTEAKIIWAHNGQEVVDYFQNIGNCEKHLILMDIKMPVLNGLEACKIIRQKNPDIPIIAVTAFAQLGDKDHIMKNGFDGYVSKPLSAEKLLVAISQYIHS
jgi:CheY-like chemotaxis protein